MKYTIYALGFNGIDLNKTEVIERYQESMMKFLPYKMKREIAKLLRTLADSLEFGNLSNGRK